MCSMYVFQRYASFFSVLVDFKLVVTLFLHICRGPEPGPAGFSGAAFAAAIYKEPLPAFLHPRPVFSKRWRPVPTGWSKTRRKRSREGSVVAVSKTATTNQEKTEAKAVQRYLRNCFSSLLVCMDTADDGACEQVGAQSKTENSVLSALGTSASLTSKPRRRQVQQASEAARS